MVLAILAGEIEIAHSNRVRLGGWFLIDDAAILEGEELVQGVLSSTAIVGRFSEGDISVAV